MSLWRALQTQSWRAGEPQTARFPVYDFIGIDHLVSQLQSDERAWRQWFTRNGQRASEVTYDELDAAPDATVAAVLRELGLPDAQVTVPRLSRQRDDLSAAWVERYRHEAGRAA